VRKRAAHLRNGIGISDVRPIIFFIVEGTLVTEALEIPLKYNRYLRSRTTSIQVANALSI